MGKWIVFLTKTFISQTLSEYNNISLLTFWILNDSSSYIIQTISHVFSPIVCWFVLIVLFQRLYPNFPNFELSFNINTLSLDITSKHFWFITLLLAITCAFVLDINQNYVLKKFCWENGYKKLFLAQYGKLTYRIRWLIVSLCGIFSMLQTALDLHQYQIIPCYQICPTIMLQANRQWGKSFSIVNESVNQCINFFLPANQ